MPRIPALPGGRLAGALAAIPLALAASAGDWSLGGSLTGELGASTRQDRDASEDGIFPRATSRLALDLGHETKRTTLGLRGTAAVVLEEGTEADGIGFLTPGLAARLVHRAPRTTLSAGLSAALRSVAFRDSLGLVDGGGEPPPDDGGEDGGDIEEVSGTATQIRVNASLGMSHEIDARNSLALNASLARLDYFDGATSLVPSTTAKLGGSWTRALSPRLSGSLSLGLTSFESEGDASRTESLSLDARLGVSWAASRNLDVRASLGGALTDSERTDLTVLPAVRTDSLDAGLVGSLGVTYSLETLSFRLDLSQSVEPSPFGALQNTTSLSLGIVREINDVSRIGLSSRLRLQEATDGGGDLDTFLLVSPYYAWDLDAVTSLRLGYAFQLDTRRAGDDASHAVYLSLTRRFDFLK